MTQAWFRLTDLSGRDIDNPSSEQRAAAIAAVYDTAKPETGLGSVVFKFGYDDGLLYELEVMSGGAVKFEEWSDEDYEVELTEPRAMLDVPQQQALQMWDWLAQRQISKIRKEAWEVLDRNKEKDWIMLPTKPGARV
ncbi:MAG: hypothetical protein RL748_3079 [Pseudomonadota bacterium]|jgi:hypothetical protein